MRLWAKPMESPPTALASPSLSTARAPNLPGRPFISRYMSDKPEDREPPSEADFRLENMEYTSDPSFLGPYIDEVLNDSYRTIQLNPANSKPASKRQKDSQAATPARPSASRLVRPRTRISRNYETYKLLEQNRPLLASLLCHLFWIVHLQLHRPG
jgi:hypothetical protein